MKKILVTGYLLFFCGCATSRLSREAESIRVTDNADDVRQCKVLGAVDSRPPYIMPSDGVNQLKNEAAALGADTLFLTSGGVVRGKSGMAYRCKQ